MDTEAIDLLLESDVKWNSYVGERKCDEVIDFSLLSLQEHELHNRIFINCDFAGAQFNFVSFDHSIFNKCVFQNARILYSSFVECIFIDCSFEGDDMDHTIFRRTKIERCVMDKNTVDHGEIVNCEILNGTFSNSRLSNIQIKETSFYSTLLQKTWLRNLVIQKCMFSSGTLVRNVLHTFLIKDTSFEKCNINGGIIRSGTTENSHLFKSTICDIRAKKHIMKKDEITQSYIRHLDLSEWSLSETQYIGTHFDRCIWPDMKYRISMLGVLKSSVNLPLTPVQDLSGIDPRLRREIRDAQYLAFLNKNCSNCMTRFFFWSWGATSGYGQSVFRLGATLLEGTIAIACVGMIVDHLFVRPVDVRHCLRYILSIFLKVIDVDPIFEVLINPWIVFAAQFFGIVWFGLLIGVIAGKLTQLGAD